SAISLTLPPGDVLIDRLSDHHSWEETPLLLPIAGGGFLFFRGGERPMFRTEKNCRRVSRSLPRPTGRKRFRPTVEFLEPRLAPANVDVLTWHNDNTLSGSNNQEEILTPANVSSKNFGSLFTYPVDGYVYAQPLYKANLTLPDGSTHNVVFVATEHDSIYAFDGDANTVGTKNDGVLWQRSFL